MTNSTPPDETAALRAEVEDLTRERDRLYREVTNLMWALRRADEASDTALERGIRLGIAAAAEVSEERSREYASDGEIWVLTQVATAIRALDPAEIVKGGEHGSDPQPR